MRVAITGATVGIGKAFRDIFPVGPSFSRSTGHNLIYPTTIDIIVKQSLDCDVFINNAYYNFAQVDLLYKLWIEWQDKEKTIVCLGSDASDYSHPNPLPYATHKRALQDACLQLHHAKKTCKVLFIKPGYVDTPTVSHVSNTKMHADDMAAYIKDLIMMNRTFWVPMVTLYPIG